MLLRRAPVTAVLLAFIALGFLGEILAGGSTDGRVLLALGANSAVLVLGQGQWWRLLSSVFLHAGFAHVLLNGWALFQLGALFEIWSGSLQMLTVFFASGVAGSLASVLWGNNLSVGASGAIFGLLGALIAFLVRRRSVLSASGKSMLLQLLFWAGINVFFGLTNPSIDNAAHFGGAAAGFLLGLVLPSREPGRE